MLFNDKLHSRVLGHSEHFVLDHHGGGLAYGRERDGEDNDVGRRGSLAYVRDRRDLIGFVRSPGPPGDMVPGGRPPTAERHSDVAGSDAAMCTFSSERNLSGLSRPTIGPSTTSATEDCGGEDTECSDVTDGDSFHPMRARPRPTRSARDKDTVTTATNSQDLIGAEG
jgi:hypothetical protein